MANLSEDIQCAGSDTRPPMLDRTDFASWKQRIRLPERPRFYLDLSPEDKGKGHMGQCEDAPGRNQATVQDDIVVVQNVQGRHNRGHGNNARGAGTVGYGGAQNRVGNDNPGQARQVKCYNCNVWTKTNAVDEDVDEQPVQDLALNVDNMFQADYCDAFNSDVDEAPITQTMFMANLSSADPVYDEAGPLYDSDILSEVHDHDQY
ncbi:hypothetical protein Tco_0664499 [Tanacetum coccineum]